MQNGDSLHQGAFLDEWYEVGNPSYNCQVGLPKPNSNHEYYLFQTYYTWGPCRPMGLIYSVVDMNLDNGLGAVVTKDVFVLNDTMEFRSLSAVKHGNGRDWWISIPEKGGRYIYLALLTPNGIEKVKKEKILDIERYECEYTVYTPDGTKCIQAINNQIRVMDFNRCEGSYGLPTFIATPLNPYNITGGLSVSPNSRFLYRSTGDTLWQVDLWSSNMTASKQIVTIADGFIEPLTQVKLGFATPQLAPDGKIYVAPSAFTYYMHVIENPDTIAPYCLVTQHIQLPYCLMNGLPHFPNYRLGAAIGSGCDTLSVSNQSAVSSNQVKVYPNPAQSYVQVELPQGVREATFVLRNALGQVVQQTDLQASTLVQLGNVAKGLYFYRIFEGNKEIGYGKVVIE